MKSSSWRLWGEPAWADLRARYAGRASFDWQVALMDSSGLPASRAQCDWFYRRSGSLVHSPFLLNSGWFDPARQEDLARNLVAEAAKDFGVSDDRVRLAIVAAAEALLEDEASHLAYRVHHGDPPPA